MSSQPPAAESPGPDLNHRGRGRGAAPAANNGLSGDGASTAVSSAGASTNAATDSASTNGASRNGATPTATRRSGASVLSSPELEEARVLAPRWQLQVPLAAPRWQVPAIALPPCWVHPEPPARPSASPPRTRVDPPITRLVAPRPAPASTQTRATPFLAAPSEADIPAAAKTPAQAGTAGELQAAPRAAAPAGAVAADADADELDPADRADLAPAKQEPKLLTRLALEWIGILAGALIVALIIKAVLVQAFVIPSRSMEPTLAIGDRVLVLRPSYRLQDVDRGDVVVFERPEQLRGGSDDSDLIKRVIGLAEETVEGRDGAVYVNGVRLEETWLPEGVRTSDFALVRVPAEYVWVMGDNRDNSQDSRVFGTLDQDRIIGEAFLRWWPVSRLAGL